ncbi:MAG: H-NS family nucleoid-associated regulatory protein [Rhodothermales bacterium]
MMENLQELIEQKTSVEKERAKIEQQLKKLRERTHKQLRKKIEKMCADAGTSVEELFGAKPKSTARKSGGAKKKSVRKSNTPDKYILNGKGVDGRKARTIKAFDKIRVDGKIDDAKALSAKMINPEWLNSKSPIVAKFVRDYKVDVAKYTGK